MTFDTLDDYLRSDGALTVGELCERIGLQHTAQLRQWRYGYANRRPDPRNCVAIEQATGGKVKRWSLRSDDWHHIWPELIGAKGAPKVKN